MDADRITTAVRLAGLDRVRLDDVEATGDDPVLRSPHRLGETAAVANALVGDAARRLWRERTGQDQTVRVDLVQAAYGLQSFLRLRFEDPALAPDLDRPGASAVTGLHPTRDGRWIQLHQSFGDGPAILALLGADTGTGVDGSTEEVTAAVAGAVAQWDGLDLETALAEAGLCGGLVRTREEWDRHPQGRALAPLPVVAIERIGDGPPVPLPLPVPLPTTGAAAGLRVLDLTRVLAGPTCGRTLAEHGADVLHVTSPRLPTVEWFDVDTGFGKRQASLDLDDADQRTVLDDLVDGTDVFVQSYRPGALARRGLGAAQLAARRHAAGGAGIVVVELSCYGHTGPWAFRPGWEQLAQAASGISEREGRETGVPRLAPAAASDYTTGMLAAAGALEAVLRRATEGGSWLVAVSLCRTAMWLGDLGEAPAAVPPGPVGQAGGAEPPGPRTAATVSPDYGRLTSVAPALALGVNRVGSDRPPVRPGRDDAAWLSRPSEPGAG